jgi:integrase
VKGTTKYLGKGVWEILVEAGKDPTTNERTRIRRRVSGKKVDAEYLLDSILSQLRDGTYSKPTATTLSEYLPQWFDQHKANLAATTIATYDAIITAHLIPNLGQHKLSTLTPRIIQAYYSSRLKANLSPRSVQQHHSVLHRALKQAVTWNLIRVNPATAATAPRPDSAKPSLPTRAETDKLLESDHKFIHLFRFTAYTGLRLGEVLGLRWEDVNLSIPAVTVRQSYSRIGGKDIFKPPKRHSVRQVLLPGVARNALESLSDRSGLVFCTNKGKPLCPSSVSRAWVRLAHKAGYKMRFHDLRHAHATYLMELGVNPRVVQERLGHKDISLTLQTYSHVSQTLQGDAVFKLNGTEKAQNEGIESADAYEI